MGRDHATGTDAQLKYVRVELFNPIGEATESAAEFTARLFTVANEVSDNSGAGGEKERRKMPPEPVAEFGLPSRRDILKELNGIANRQIR